MCAGRAQSLQRCYPGAIVQRPHRHCSALQLHTKSVRLRLVSVSPRDIRRTEFVQGWIAPMRPDASAKVSGRSFQVSVLRLFISTVSKQVGTRRGCSGRKLREANLEGNISLQAHERVSLLCSYSRHLSNGPLAITEWDFYLEFCKLCHSRCADDVSVRNRRFCDRLQNRRNQV
jgi:hypothetical protein